MSECRANEIMDTIDMLTRGLIDQNKVLNLQREMLSKILHILTKDDNEPSPLIEALQAVVATLHEVKASTDWIEQDLAARPHR